MIVNIKGFCLTLSITTFSIMIISINGFYLTFSITMLCIMLSIIMLNVTFYVLLCWLLNVFMLSVVMLNVVAPFSNACKEKAQEHCHSLPSVNKHAYLDKMLTTLLSSLIFVEGGHYWRVSYNTPFSPHFWCKHWPLKHCNKCYYKERSYT